MSSNLKNKLFSFSAAAVLCAALQSGVMSGQIVSSTGGDHNVRALLRATDSSIALWVLNPSLDNLGLNKYYGPYLGWEPLGISTAADNYSFVLWKNTDGSIALWILDSTLNFVNQKVFGPYPGWNPLTLSANSNGLTTILWKRTDGYLSMWNVYRDFSITADKQFGPFPAFDPQARATAAKDSAAQSAKTSEDITNPVARSDRD